MAAGGKYNIDLLKIKHLTDNFKFSVENRFFDGFESSTIKEGNIEVDIHIEHTANTYDTKIDVEGSVKLECDRCLNMIDFPVKGSLELVVKMIDGHKESDDEIVYVPIGEGVFDASQHIYDCIYLALPLRKTCEEAGVPEGCDSKVIEKLNRVEYGEDKQDAEDPRWDKLKDLL
jgi:uncharacterized protein